MALDYVRFQVVKTESTITASWDVAPHNLVVYRRFGDGLLHPLIMEAASTPETSINFHQSSRCNTSEDSYVYTRRHENLKSHSVNCCLLLLLKYAF
jgi:hypothetical protein